MLFYSPYSQWIKLSQDLTYVDGLSITLGSPRKHIWTFAAGFSETGIVPTLPYCPCAASPGNAPFPFIGNDYYCETGNSAGNPINIYYTSDPLWDGNGCVQSNTNCCANVDMPWFYRAFAMSQQDDIEARICTDQHFNDEAVAIDQLKLFIQ